MSNEIANSENDCSEKLALIDGLLNHPHLIEHICYGLSCKTLSECEKVSPVWNQMLYTLSIWRKKWKMNTTVSTRWRMLSTRLQHTRPALFYRMKEGDISSYQEACNYVEQNIRQIFHCSIKSHTFYDLKHDWIDERSSTRGSALGHVDDRNIYFGRSDGAIEIVNRWTGSFVNRLVSPFHFASLRDFQLNDKFLISMFTNGKIVVYDLASLQMIQSICDFQTGYRRFGGFCLVNDNLVNLVSSKDGKSVLINRRQWNPSTGKFGPEIKNSIVNEYRRITFFKKVYSDGKFLILDTEQMWERIIQVFDLESLQMVRQLSCSCRYSSSHFIKSEYCNGEIVVENVSPKGEHYLEAWNVEKNVVRPITNHPMFRKNDKMSYSAVMNQHSNCRILIRQCDQILKLHAFELEDKRCGETRLKRRPNYSDFKCKLNLMKNNERLVFTAVSEDNSSIPKHFHQHIPIAPRLRNEDYYSFFYFDGVQFIFICFGGLNIVNFDV